MMMAVSQLLESVMLALFATSWFWLLRKVWRERRGRGIPIAVPLMVTAGCMLGVASKVAFYASTGYMSFLVLIYGWTALVSLGHLFLMLKTSGGAGNPGAEGIPDGEPESTPV